MTIDFFLKIAVRTIHEKRGTELFMCALSVLRFLCGKDTYTCTQTILREEIAISVVPSEKIMSPKGFLWTAFVLLNSRHQLTSA